MEVTKEGIRGINKRADTKGIIRIETTKETTKVVVIKGTIKIIIIKVTASHKIKDITISITKRRRGTQAQTIEMWCHHLIIKPQRIVGWWIEYF